MIIWNNNKRVLHKQLFSNKKQINMLIFTINNIYLQYIIV